jgi:hypothetical protein
MIISQRAELLRGIKGNQVTWTRLGPPRCPARASIVLEKVDNAGRHVRQIELCDGHSQIVIERERARGLRDIRSSRLALEENGPARVRFASPFAELGEERTKTQNRRPLAIGSVLNYRASVY